MEKEDVVLLSPRNFIIFIMQYMAIAPFSVAFCFILLPFLTKVNNNIYDFIILFLLILFFLIVSILLLYFPQMKRSKCVYNPNKKVLNKIRGEKIVLACDLKSIDKIILKIRKEDIGVNIKLLLEKAENNNIELYSEQSYFSYKQWLIFADKLSKSTFLPLEKEYYKI